MNICVLGAGGWGTALAILLHNNKHKVTLWEYEKEYAHTLDEFRENFYYLPKVKIPKEINITNDIDIAVYKKDLIVISTPTQFIRHIIESVKHIDLTNRIILSVSKGIENETLMTVSNIFLDVFNKIKKRNIVVLSGPSHAEEVSRNIPTAVVAASLDIQNAAKVQKTFSNKFFRVYRSTDMKGVELGGALKNVIAIAAGIADGAGFGDNTKAAIMTRGMREITRLGLKLGASEQTFFGLSGIGDLIVTCASKLSRNRFVGEEIGKGKKLKQVISELKMVAEGVATTKSTHELGQKLRVELPIIEQVHKVLFVNKNPHKATEILMTRNLKTEH
ncbi:MAG: NAD(P)-dependent glycerol-3-phosphate dehydrogenase [Ignavibacteriae bacterium]|nr:MAG: NAD(P)-dependent glycerol-3-phosphate dehydrogenase [Ignavibacteriota bacterium]